MYEFNNFELSFEIVCQTFWISTFYIGENYYDFEYSYCCKISLNFKIL